MESHLTEFQTIVGDWLRVEPTQVQMVTDGVNKNLRVTVDHQDVFKIFTVLIALEERVGIRSRSIEEVALYGAPML